jgi:hypothetical protein
MEDNLWGTIELGNITTPLSILKKQAESLEYVTKGILTGEVNTGTYNTSLREPVPIEKLLGSAPQIYYAFLIKAPFLNDYKYNLFTVKQQEPTLLYPAHIYFEDKEYSAKDEQEFILKLKDILNSPKTTSIIQSLYAQSQ